LQPTAPLALLRSLRNRVRDRILPLRKIEIDGIKFYYTRGNEPQDPKKMGQVREMHDELDQNSGRNAVDVGAHIGSYTLPLARRFGGVIAFEPNPSVRHILRLNLRLNHIKNVRIEDAALSDAAGTRPLFLQTGTGATSSLNPLHYHMDYQRSIPVRVARLDDFSFENVDLLKIDAEGYELPILRGGTQTIARFRPIIFVEIHESRKGLVDACECDTCRYLVSIAYNPKLLGEYASTPTHWVEARPCLRTEQNFVNLGSRTCSP
jgi:FkbM family methyltransferase